MDAVHGRENGLSLEASRRRYSGMLTRLSTDRRTAGRGNGVELSRPRWSFVAAGGLIVFFLGLALTGHFVLLKRTKQRLGF